MTAYFAAALVATVAAVWIATALLLGSRHRQETPARRQPDVDQLGMALVVSVATTDPNKQISDREWRKFYEAHDLPSGEPR